MAPADPRRTPAVDKKTSDALAETNVPSQSDDFGDTNVPPSRPASTPKPVAARTPVAVTAPGGSSSPASSSSGSKGASGSKASPVAKDAAADGDAKKPKKVSQVGDFRIEKKLGQGGMGTVFLATQVSLERKVALKTLSPELAKKQDFVKRFLREARSMARLQHPNVVQVYAADSVSGVNYAAIEFIDGRSMQGWMNELKQLDLGDALHVVLVCADALKHAHDQNMIHRDIKPDNILVTSKGVVKVADFGLAKAIDEDVSMTQSGTGLGTPLYMAPEQARNAKHVDKRTDIYALGSTLYYFLTGKLPFTGENTLELIIAKEKGTFTHAKKLNPQIPERLDLMIDKMLTKDPNHRYADCAEIMRDLGGLGLANPALSFIESSGGGTAVVSAAVAVASSASASRVPTTRGGSAAGQSAKLPPAPADRLTSSADAARSAAKAPVSGKTWFVQHKGADGKVVISKMSTPEVMAGIKGETLDPAAKAKDSPNGTFLPLAQYREFESLASNRAVKMQAEARSRKTQDIYNKLDKQEQRRKRWRWLKKLVGNVKGLISLVLYLAILGALGFGGYWALTHIDEIKGMLSKQPTVPAATSAPAPAGTTAPNPTPP
jgi:serine/threonine-protein kinase